MSSKGRAECDECGFTFKIRPPRKRHMKEDIYKIYFKCPRCKAEFVSYYENETVKILMSRNREILELANNNISHSKREELREEYDNNIIAIQEEQEKIKKNLDLI